MKKLLLSVLLCFCLVVPCAVGLAGCGHEHDFLEFWTFNSTHHWHECEDCDQVKGKAEHEWDAGLIITDPTPTADGVKKFTCEVCGKTKTEAVAYVPTATVTSSEWTAALAFSDTRLKIEFVAGTTKFVIVRQGDATHRFEYNNNVLTEEAYYVKSGISYYKYVVDETTYYKEEITEERYNSMTKLTFSCDYNADAYNAATKAYEFPVGFGSHTNTKLYFEDAKLVRMTWVGYNDDTTPVEVNFEYGTATVTVPTQNVVQTTVSQSAWNIALALENKTNYQITQNNGTNTLRVIKDGDKAWFPDGGMMYVYLEKDGSNYYGYTYNTDSYQKVSIEQNVYDVNVNPLDSISLDYANFTYNSSTRSYFNATGSGSLTNINLYFEDGVLVKVTGEGEGQTLTAIFTYDEVVVDLPDVE